MGTLLMRQASNFLQEKYKAARWALTNISEAELLVEAVTDDNPWCPDTKTMAQIAEATYDFDGYWKIVDLLHKRLGDVNWKKWRQSYNSLILLEFLIMHGPEDFAIEFRSDVDVIKELGTFRYIDKRGVNWGHYMRNKTERILKCLQGGSSLQEIRSKAIKLTNEIQGFGSSSSSSTSPSSTSSPTSSSWRSSFESSSPSSPTLWHDNTHYEKTSELNRHAAFEYQQDLLEANSPKENTYQHKMLTNFLMDDKDLLDWNSIEDTFTEIDLNDDYDERNKKKVGFFKGICAKHVGYSPLKKGSERKKNT